MIRHATARRKIAMVAVVAVVSIALARPYGREASSWRANVDIGGATWDLAIFAYPQSDGSVARRIELSWTDAGGLPVYVAVSAATGGTVEAAAAEVTAVARSLRRATAP